MGLSESIESEESLESQEFEDWGRVQPCPNCGEEMVAVVGRKDAVCQRWGLRKVVVIEYW